MDDKNTVVEESIEEMGNKSRKVIFFTLTHGVTLSTTVSNLEKKHKGQENATRNQLCYLLYQRNCLPVSTHINPKNSLLSFSNHIL